jgi:predicted DNA binding protein
MSKARVIRGEVPAEEFALWETLQLNPDARLEAERIVQSGEDALMPLIWVRNTDFDEFEEALEDDPSVREYTTLSTFEDEVLYRMIWISEVDLALQMLANSNATIMDAYGYNRRWQLRLLYPNQDSLSKTTEYIGEHDLTFDVLTIREVEGEPIGRFGLTKSQYEALTVAQENGFYEVPREIKLQELAEHLDISHQALSERLRRGVNALITEALIPGENTEVEDLD